MHTMALIGGAYLHFVGDTAATLIIVFLLRNGPSGYVYDEYYEYSSVSSAAFRLMPIPIGMALAGLLLARWGLTGM